MKYLNFKEKAVETGASKCIYFDFGGLVNSNCGKNDKYCSCKVFKGLSCNEKRETNTL